MRELFGKALLREQGKRLPNLREYAASLLPMDAIDDSAVVNHHGLVTDSAHRKTLAVQTSEKGYRLMPGPEFSPRLYRGQNRFYQKCVPSGSRQRPIDRLFWIVKSVEFGALVSHHPAYQDLSSFELEGLSFDFNIWALAQHYGYSTNLLDFSRSKDVAMFFATCLYDHEGDTYSPLESGEAVLYTADLCALIGRENFASRVLPLGLEPLPRPEAQKAFAVQMLDGEDLNQMGWCRFEKFKITAKVSHRYFEMFEGGEILFPSNPFDAHIDSLRRNNTVPIQAIEIGMNFPSPDDVEYAANAYIKMGYQVSGDTVYPDDVIFDAAAADWNARRTEFFSRIGLRGMCDHFQG